MVIAEESFRPSEPILRVSGRVVVRFGEGEEGERVVPFRSRLFSEDESFCAAPGKGSGFFSARFHFFRVIFFRKPFTLNASSGEEVSGKAMRRNRLLENRNGAKNIAPLFPWEIFFSPSA